MFARSKNVPTSIAIDQESSINHFGMIKTQKIPIITSQGQGNPTNKFVFAVFGPLLDTVFGLAMRILLKIIITNVSRVSVRQTSAHSTRTIPIPEENHRNDKPGVGIGMLRGISLLSAI